MRQSKNTIWKVVAKIMLFLPQAAAGNARLGSGGSWRSVLTLAPPVPCCCYLQTSSKTGKQGEVSLPAAGGGGAVHRVSVSEWNSVVCGRLLKWIGSEHL